MRANRLTVKTAEAAIDAARRICLNPWAQMKFPSIDVKDMFKGRKSITWKEALEYYTAALNAVNR